VDLNTLSCARFAEFPNADDYALTAAERKLLQAITDRSVRFLIVGWASAGSVSSSSPAGTNVPAPTSPSVWTMCRSAGATARELYSAFRRVVRGVTAACRELAFFTLSGRGVARDLGASRLLVRPGL
jgi:hypothetical protein